ncbi:MAG: DUF2807 domain-containing protein [Hyphomonadaceae bacterium]
MHRTFAPALIALAALAAGPAAAETRALSGFDGVAVRDRIEVEVATGQSFRVEVSGPDAARVRTRVEDGTLDISRANRSWFGNNGRIDATVRVTAPAIDSLAAARGAEIRATGIRADDMSLAAAMGGDIRIDGSCRTLDAAVSMGGMVRADEFQCEDADIAASMGGEARVYASRRFEAAASMGGAVNVAGGGARGDVATSMGGLVSQN